MYTMGKPSSNARKLYLTFPYTQLSFKRKSISAVEAMTVIMGLHYCISPESTPTPIEGP